MDLNEGQILERELAKVGALGGFAGGFVPGAIGGYLGAKFSARFLPTETFSDTVEAGLSAEMAVQAAYGVLRGEGQITTGQTEETSLPQLTAVVGSGAMNMNPTIVAVTVAPISHSSCTLTISGAAKEGLIKQHSAKMAVMRIREALLKACGAQ